MFIYTYINKNGESFKKYTIRIHVSCVYVYWLTYLKCLLTRRFDRRRRNKRNPFWEPRTLFIYCLRLLFILKFYLHQLLLRIYI